MHQIQEVDIFEDEKDEIIREKLEKKFKDLKDIARSNNAFKPKQIQNNNENDIWNSRGFALILIGLASVYVLIMICQAYKTNMDRMNILSEQDVYLNGGATDSSYEY